MSAGNRAAEKLINAYLSADEKFQLRLKVHRRYPDVELNSDEFFRKLREMKNTEPTTDRFGETICCPHCKSKQRKGYAYCTQCAGRLDRK